MKFLLNGKKELGSKSVRLRLNFVPIEFADYLYCSVSISIRKIIKLNTIFFTIKKKVLLLIFLETKTSFFATYFVKLKSLFQLVFAQSGHHFSFVHFWTLLRTPSIGLHLMLSLVFWDFLVLLDCLFVLMHCSRCSFSFTLYNVVLFFM